MLDTNIASHVIKGDRPEILKRLATLPMDEIVISSITEGEFALRSAKRGYPKVLSERGKAIPLRVDVLPWITTSREPMVTCAPPVKPKARFWRPWT